MPVRRRAAYRRRSLGWGRVGWSERRRIPRETQPASPQFSRLRLSSGETATLEFSHRTRAAGKSVVYAALTGITEMPEAGRIVSVLLMRPGSQRTAGFHPVVTLSPDLLAVQCLKKQRGLIDIRAR